MTKALAPKALTVRERKWIARVNKALAACPSKRLGFATMGDPSVTIYDRRFDAALDEHGGDFMPAIDELEVGLGELRFPAPVHSTSA